MGNDLQERVMLERVELIARLTSQGFCKERDREIALNLIADIASNALISKSKFNQSFCTVPFKKR